MVSPVLVDLSVQDLREQMGAALAVYVRAMGYPESTAAHRAPLWAEHALRPGWQAVAALADQPRPDDPDPAFVGIAYGYRTTRGQWWSEEVRTGLVRLGRTEAQVDALLEGAFELTELHVHPDLQGQHLGQRLLTALLAGRPEPRVLLSTPEAPDADNRAWRLYRRVGFTDVLRDFRFTGDNRPFAVLARTLPLHV